MATPLFSAFKQRGTTFYCFPSSSQDINLAFQNDQYKMTFTKFTLLNIPEQQVVISSGTVRNQEKGVMNFDKSQDGTRFYNFQPGANANLPTVFGDQLIESLRDYVANYDSTLRESRINSNTDFFNIHELVQPPEMIFWKWCRKLNLIDFEPASHKIDWDKNLTDFNNNNGTDNSFFQKYLWKERDVNYYTCQISQYSGNLPALTIDGIAKFKIGDNVKLSGYTGTVLTGISYDVLNVIYPTSTSTVLILNQGNYLDSNPYNSIVYLNYTPLVQYVGEIQSTSKVQTSKMNYTSIVAQIPHQCGKTPTILFETVDNSNFYPNLEMPILPAEQQEEIVGAENSSNPIRTNPQNYPGSYFGYFDSYDKTYKCSAGDRLRYSGDYYGVLLNNNLGTGDENYQERLTEFNSDNLDGIKITFDKDWYLKMNLPNTQIKNFDDFNSAYLDGTPEDFKFNAILWYYEMDDGSGNIKTNLLGIEFLNNPSNDFDECDTNNKKITPYEKLVSNGNQDGTSYIFPLNLTINNDNGSVPLSYDPTTIYNQFGFDLYQNVLQTNAKLQENFTTIISGFTNINQKIFEMESSIYSQTDINIIKSEINNLNDLLTLYSTFQFKNSNTALIETNFDGIYPTLKVNVISTKYDSITNVNVSDVFNYNESNSGISYIVAVPLQNQMLLTINNDNNDINGNATILLNRDLQYEQQLDIIIQPNMSSLAETLNINIYYNDGTTTTEQSLISNITLPVDLISYNSLNPTASTYTNSYYTNDNVITYSLNMTSGSTTTLQVNDMLFNMNDNIYINNFYVTDGINVTDISGVYQVSATTTDSIILDYNSYGLALKSFPKISYYKGWQISILNVSSINSSTIGDRYKITKKLI